MNIVPIADKYALTIGEASKYFNIGETKLRKLIAQSRDKNFILIIGTKTLIKRRLFEKWLDSASAI